MPITSGTWLFIAATISALSDAVNLGISFNKAYEKYTLRRVGNTARLSRRVRVLRTAFSTYSTDEVEAIAERLRRCRDRFIREGAGSQRAKCLCSVLEDVRDGNGGMIPVAAWRDAYKQLQCAKLKSPV